MKGITSHVIAALAGAQVALASYNGKIQYFIADIGTTSPCHPKYERSYTWVDTSNIDSMDYVLDGLVRAGFNGIRLPMWPEDARVRGPDPSNEGRDISRTFCESINENWVKRIR